MNRQQGKKPYIEDVEVSDVDKEGRVVERPEEEVAAEAWGNYLRRDRSIVVDTFQGQLKSTVTREEGRRLPTTAFLLARAPSSNGVQRLPRKRMEGHLAQVHVGLL